MKLTVFFDGQFWVGVVEEVQAGRLKAVKHVFGPEPKDPEILDFIQTQLLDLTSRMSQEIATKAPHERRVNPKRLARQVANEIKGKGISSHAQEALKLEYEKKKKEKQTLSKQQKEEMQERKREIKRNKAKEKHRGR